MSDFGFYDEDEADKRVPILSVRLGNGLEAGALPQFQYLSTECETFARYAEARANRRDPFDRHIERVGQRLGGRRGQRGRLHLVAVGGEGLEPVPQRLGRRHRGQRPLRA